MNPLPVINCALGKSDFHIKKLMTCIFWNHICQNSLFGHLDFFKALFSLAYLNVNWIISGFGGSNVFVASCGCWPGEMWLPLPKDKEATKWLIKMFIKQLCTLDLGKLTRHEVEYALEMLIPIAYFEIENILSFPSIKWVARAGTTAQ